MSKYADNASSQTGQVHYLQYPVVCQAVSCAAHEDPYWREALDLQVSRLQSIVQAAECIE